MSNGSRATAGLRERLTTGTEDKLGRALADLLDNPLVSGTIGRAFDARDRAAQAQELALSALNIPTAADIERLTRRLRSVSQRLEGIEDGVHRLNRALSDGGVERRLTAMEGQLKALSSKLVGERTASAGGSKEAAEVTASEPAQAKAAANVAGSKAAASKASGTRAAASKKATAKRASGGQAAAKRASGGRTAAKPASGKRAATEPPVKGDSRARASRRRAS
jgi:hypothetical protein